VTTYGADYTSRITPAALRAKGVKFVVRYLASPKANGPSWKEIRAEEYAELQAAGINVCFVWEDGGGAAAGGFSRGVRDAKAANARLAALGITLDKSRPIFFAIDYDAPLSVSASYIRGAASVRGFSRTGVYGGYKQVKYCLDTRACAWAWQTLAWSKVGPLRRLMWDPRAHMRQTGSSTIARQVVDDDYATVADYGQTPAPKPVLPPGGGGTGVPVPPAGVHLSDLKAGVKSQSAAIVNQALKAEGILAAKLVRSRWSIAARYAFRVFKNKHKISDNTAAFKLLGRLHGFPVYT